MILVCMCIKYQLKTIADSYSSLGLNHIESKRINQNTKSAEAILDLKLLIHDQQKIFEKMKNMYQILKPATFIQLAAESFQIILQPCMMLKRESMNFALYSSNWTDMSIKFKKLLLLTMRMNDAENLKMKISMKRIVNMEMFADVVHTAYSIVSVMTKSLST
eukprot:XP_016657287.1 PREDICTED: uncharacterized protein LOC107882832 [Acyrthosiphon pisum]